MAVIGQALTAPESGWKRYEVQSSDIFPFKDNTTTLTMLSSASASGGTYFNSASSQVGEFFYFYFKGTKLRIIGSVSNFKSDNIKIEIDGVIYSYNQGSDLSTISWQILLFEKEDLEDKVHKVKIYTDADTTKRLHGDEKYAFDIDVIDIDESGDMIVPSKKLILKNPETNQHYSLTERVVITLPDGSDESIKSYGISAGVSIQLDEAFNVFIKCKVEPLLKREGEHIFKINTRSIKKINIKG